MAFTESESQRAFDKLIETGPLNEIEHLKPELRGRFDSIVKRSGLTEAIEVFNSAKSALEEEKPPGYGIVLLLD
ncbi:MAG: hypothetical protein OXG98_14920 [Gemmatimonadetes bacterium]|nr:hypothetical protein [Gemmatimonadota bacterium]